MRKLFIVFLLMAGVHSLALPAFSSDHDSARQRVIHLIEKIVSQFPDYEGGRVEVKSMEDFGHLAGWDHLPDAVFQLGPTLSGFRPGGTVVFPIEVYRGSQKQDAFSVRAQVSVYKPIVVSKLLLRKGEKLAGDNVEVQGRDVALLPKKYSTSVQDVLGKEVLLTVPAGRPLFAWMIREEPLVHRDSLVKLYVLKGNIRVEATGRALEDGLMEKPLKVRNESSRKEIMGVVRGPGLVEVNTP